jgi:hypothetical protein
MAIMKMAMVVKMEMKVVLRIFQVFEEDLNHYENVWVLLLKYY